MPKNSAKPEGSLREYVIIDHRKIVNREIVALFSA